MAWASHSRSHTMTLLDIACFPVNASCSEDGGRGARPTQYSIAKGQEDTNSHVAIKVIMKCSWGAWQLSISNIMSLHFTLVVWVPRAIRSRGGARGLQWPRQQRMSLRISLRTSGGRWRDVETFNFPLWREFLPRTFSFPDCFNASRQAWKSSSRASQEMALQ